MKKWIEISQTIIFTFIFLFASFSAYSQERYEKVNIYMYYGYPMVFQVGCDYNENHTRVNHKVFFSTEDLNFKYELKGIIDNLKKTPYENYKSDFFCYVVIDFIQNSKTTFSVALDEYGNYRFEDYGKIYKIDETLVKFLFENFRYFLDSYHDSYNKKNGN